MMCILSLENKLSNIFDKIVSLQLLCYSRKLNCREVGAVASGDDLERKTRIPLELWTETAELLLSGKHLLSQTWFPHHIFRFLVVFY